MRNLGLTPQDVDNFLSSLQGFELLVGIAATKFSIKLSKGSNGKIKVEPIENKTVDVKPKASKLESDITKKVSLNTNIAESNFGIYEITIDGELYKIGKADLEQITKSSGLQQDYIYNFESFIQKVKLMM